MFGGIQVFLLTMFVIAMLYAAWGDWRTREIPNWLNAAIALSAPAYWWASGYELWPGIAVIVGLALALFIMFTFAFAIGAMGGGDVKMIGAVALWMTPMQLPLMLVVMAIGGGFLTIGMMIRHKISKSEEKIEVPYGIAIAAGASVVAVNAILTIWSQTP